MFSNKKELFFEQLTNHEKLKLDISTFPISCVIFKVYLV